MERALAQLPVKFPEQPAHYVERAAHLADEILLEGLDRLQPRLGGLGLLAHDFVVAQVGVLPRDTCGDRVDRCHRVIVGHVARHVIEQGGSRHARRARQVGAPEVLPDGFEEGVLGAGEALVAAEQDVAVQMLKGGRQPPRVVDRVLDERELLLHQHAVELGAPRVAYSDQHSPALDRLRRDHHAISVGERPFHFVP
ncbi:hypothetical protein [Azospirillum sp. OGB3]|uniref:hypothetical protein n=1 Tax=Azospirillum sp. OGB3 TaxID=2587012 RepID=UPI0020005199|nr:hypothetical protein [Azospirillum sp. OGB3]